MKKIILITFLGFFTISCNNTEPINLAKPWNCITAKSQCNTCWLDDTWQYFECTEAFCENETFTCTTYK